MSALQGQLAARSGMAPLRAMLPFVRPYRALVLGWLGFLALSSSATLALPVAVRFMIDQGFGSEDAASIDRYFAALFLVAVVLALATAARFYFVTLLGEKIIADIRKRIYDHLLTLDQAFYEAARTGELISRLSADTELLRTVVASSASVAVRSVVIVLGAGIALALTSPRLAGFAAIGIPFVILPIVLFGRKVRGLSQESQDRIADANARAGETLNAMHTVQSYVREVLESERFGHAVARALRSAARRVRAQASLTAAVILLVFGAITLVLWIGAKDVIAGGMSVGALGQFVLYAVIAAGSVGALTEVWSEVQRAAGGMQRIRELLDTAPQVVTSPYPLALPVPRRGHLHFNGVTFRYPTRPQTAALENFHLEIHPGETVALVGPSGAGKSTVFQLLLRFYDPQQGSIHYDGVDIRKLDPGTLRESMALVPQDAVIFGADAMENIRYGRLDASDEQVIAAAHTAEAHEFLSTLPESYATFLGERGVRLSGGQQQRIAIARAVLKDAPVLLLDEATSALDAQSEHAIQQALERIMRNRTTLVIAHRLSTVLAADRIVVLDAGRIVAEGNHQELVTRGGLYAELARLQFAA